MGFKRLTLLSLMVATMITPSIRAAQARPVQIVAFGDSLTAGYGVGPGESFPEKLQSALKARGHDVVISNAGVSGDTSTGGLARLEWSVPDGTDLVIVELGANDMLRGVAPAITQSNLDAILAKLKARNIPAVLAGMRAAPNLGTDYVSSFEAIFPGLAQKYGLPLYPFFLEGVAAQRVLLQADGLHPSPRGVDVIVAGILPVIEAALGKKPAS